MVALLDAEQPTVIQHAPFILPRGRVDLPKVWVYVDREGPTSCDLFQLLEPQAYEAEALMQTIPKDGHYYWLLWKHRPGVGQEWMVALYIEGIGWQLPGVLYSVDKLDMHILRVGDEVTRRAA